MSKWTLVTDASSGFGAELWGEGLVFPTPGEGKREQNSWY